MRYALVDADRVEATPNATATCPTCNEPVRAKCGQIVSWHWAHLAAECDSWAEPDSTWHRGWQENVAPWSREVVMGAHRADIVTASGTVVELQHSSISGEDIAERERYYGPNMVWVFDAQEAYENDRFIVRRKPTHVTFRWKQPRKSIALCRRRVYLDLGNEQLLDIRGLYPDRPFAGWGYLVDTDSFCDWLVGARLIA